jgi:uncharacterized membrane protein YdjX (TVP38/TMEM64 family)
MFLLEVQSLILNYPKVAGLILISAKIIGALILFPGTPLTLLAGATFGIFYGTIISLVGNSLGAILAFFISRYFLKDFVSRKILIKYKKINDYEKRFSEQGFKTVLLLRLIPLFPFNVLNYLLGVTSIKTKDYIWGTVIGIVPGTIAFVYFGEALRMLSIFHILVSLLAIVALIYIGKYYEKK